MQTKAPIDLTYLTETLQDLLNTPSPTGYTEGAIAFLDRELADLGLSVERTPKGNLFSILNGASDSAPRALTAHVDTLGAMVKKIKSNGRLKLTQLGGFAWNTVEGEGCQVFTSSGSIFRGALMLTKASAHVFGDEVSNLERSDDTLEVRIDERTTSSEETYALGIEVGDYVTFDPRVEVCASGYIRSRHLDDKSGVACILAAVKAMRDSGRAPAQRTTLHFSTHEEVGHGAAASLPPDLFELVAVDMAAVGEGQNSDEYHTTICTKDAGGPYHHTLTNQLRALAEKYKIPYKLDIYPHYRSDAEAYWRAGGDVRIALIGPGVDASHNYERTHLDALTATVQLILAYLWS
jgi:putative aminopeptidase FrvX